MSSSAVKRLKRNGTEVFRFRFVFKTEEDIRSIYVSLRTERKFPRNGTEITLKLKYTHFRLCFVSRNGRKNRSTSDGMKRKNENGTILTALMSPTENDTPILEPKERKSPSITKEELGRATPIWALLHMIGAQYPDKPTEQRKSDVTNMMHIISRIYPCKECTDHFHETLRENPVEAGSNQEFSHWLCHAHNIVNERLNKKIFPCEKVKEKWVKFGCKNGECEEADE